MNADAFREARERDGDASEDRPARVDDILKPREKVGCKNELPLLDCDYSEYPSGDDILRPEAGDCLRTLAEHDKVGSAADIADELSTTEDQVRKAARLHGVDIPESGFDVTVDTDRLHALVGDLPENIVTAENPILLATLYVEKGLSTDEIAEVLAEGTDSPNLTPRDVRQSLIDVGVLDGLTTEERDYQRRQNRHEINKPQYSGGVTIDVNDYA